MSQVVVTSSSRLAFISGQVALDENFEVVGDNDYYEQSMQVLRNLKIAVEAAGGNIGNIINATVYLKNLSSEASQQYLRALESGLDGRAFPVHAFTMVGVQALGMPELLVEVSATAALDD